MQAGRPLQRNCAPGRAHAPSKPRPAPAAAAPARRARGARVAAQALPSRPQHRELPSTAAAAASGLTSASAAAIALPSAGGDGVGHQDLANPAHIHANGQANATLPDFGGDVSLQTYMRLPIEQYFVLDPKSITFLGGSRFRLLVPRINLLGTWIEPQVEVTVRNEEGAVVLQADRCIIRGSDQIEKLRLNERFTMTFTTRLTWQNGADSSGSDGGSRSSSSISSAAPSNAAQAPAAVTDEAAAGKQQPKFSLGSLGLGRLGLGSKQRGQQQQQQQGSIAGEAQVDVWCEVIPPFHLMPRASLEASCNAVLRGLVGSLLPLFVNQLASDYQRWAGDAAYRAHRAARSKPLAAADTA